MAAHSTRAALAALFTCASVLQAGANSPFCTPGTNGGTSSLNFKTKPAMVVHDDTLTVTFDEAGLVNETGGPGNEPLFSFSRTIDSILKSSGEITDGMDPAARQATRVDFVRTMLASLRPDDGVMLNAKSGVLIPVDDRSRAEGAIPAERLLDFSDPDFGLQPRALFNRFDAAPANWTHCGEYRVVYTLRPRGQGESRNERLLLIFEAAVPNPLYVSPAESGPEFGCRAMAEYWAGLPETAADRIARGKLLSELYYQGVEGVTTPAGTGPGNPVLSYKNFGGDGSKGQVRANMFFNGDWQLREWLTRFTVDGLAFVPETVKDNPTAELYMDDLSRTTVANANIPSVLMNWHADFVEHFVGTLQDNLMVERSPKFLGLVEALKGFALTDVSRDKLLLTLLPLGSNDQFNEFQSVSQGSSDIVPNLAGQVFKRTISHINSRRDLLGPDEQDRVRSETTGVLLARAGATTCAGCHEWSVGSVVRTGDAANGVAELKWPPAAVRFVHVSETQQLSLALEDVFLPVRRFIMGTHLCRELTAPPASPAMTIGGPASPYYTDAIISSFAATAPSTATATVGAAAVSFQALPAEMRAVAVEALDARIDAEREAERNTPGAFIEVRRPH